jgi:signal peptidase II
MIFFGWAIFVILIDQISKYYIQHRMYLGESIPIIKGIFHITYIENIHTAFGLFRYQSIFFIIAAVISLILAVLIYKKIVFKKNPKMYIPLLFILGGAIGNLIDRIRTGGKVIDFLDFRIWPVFNFADTAIVCGMFILVIYFLFYSKEENEE